MGLVADFKRTSEGDCKKSAAVIFSDAQFLVCLRTMVLM